MPNPLERRLFNQLLREQRLARLPELMLDKRNMPANIPSSAFEAKTLPFYGPFGDEMLGPEFLQELQQREERDLYADQGQAIYEKDRQAREGIAQQEAQRQAQYERMIEPGTPPTTQPSYTSGNNGGGLNRILKENVDPVIEGIGSNINEFNEHVGIPLLTAGNEAVDQMALGLGTIANEVTDTVAPWLTEQGNKAGGLATQYEAAKQALIDAGFPNPTYQEIYNVMNNPDLLKGMEQTPDTKQSQPPSAPEQPAELISPDTSSTGLTPGELAAEPPSPVSEERGGIAGLTDDYDVTGEKNLPEEERQSLHEWAKSIGITLTDKNTKPYSNWDYIRDMSASLLASKDDNFLTALGEASIASNTKRDAAELRESTLHDRLAIARWKNDEAIDAAKLKAEAVVDAATARAGAVDPRAVYADATVEKTIRGETITARPIISGWQYINPNERFKERVNGVDYWYHKTIDSDSNYDDEISLKKTNELIKGVEDWFGHPEVYMADIKSRSHGMTYQGNALLEYAKTDEYKDNISNYDEAFQKTFENWHEAAMDGDAEDLKNYSDALVKSPVFAKFMKEQTETGPLATLMRSEEAALGSAVRRKAVDLVNEDKDKTGVISKMRYIEDATDHVLQNAKWNLPPAIRFDDRFTEGTWKETERAWGDIVGKDLAGDWLNFNWLDTAEFPVGHPLKTWFKDNPMSRAGESPLWNKDQWELLSKNKKALVLQDLAAGASYIAKDQNKTIHQGLQDMMNSYVDSNVVRDGNDVPGWDNFESNFFKPHKLYKEPDSFTDKNGTQFSTQVLRDKGMMWNLIDGRWFTYDEAGTYRSMTPDQARQKGWDVEDAKSFKP